MKVIYYTLLASYFYKEVIYYSYIAITLSKSNFGILLEYFITFKSNNNYYVT